MKIVEAVSPFLSEQQLFIALFLLFFFPLRIDFFIVGVGGNHADRIPAFREPKIGLL